MKNDYYIKDFYDQFEKLNNKFDKVLNENKNLKLQLKYELNRNHNKLINKLEADNNTLTIKLSEQTTKLKTEIKTLKEEYKKERMEFKKTINELGTELTSANELIKKQQEEIDRLKNKTNKNSSNSSKPPSTDINKPQKTGANQYSYRKKSGKSIGAQPGHEPHYLSKEKIEKIIKEKKIEEREYHHVIKGNKKEETIKYKIGLEVNVYVEKHKFKYDEKATETLPKEYQSDVTYNNSIKSLSIELGTYNVVAYDRLSDFFNVITNGIINISNGTLVNFLKEFSNKSKKTIENIKDNVLDGEILKTDETTTEVNGKNYYIRNHSNEKNVLYKAHKNKGDKAIEEHEILTKYLGIIIADHDTALYKYGSFNSECNVHLGRYFEELRQSVEEITWAKKMKDLLFELKAKREEAIENKRKRFSNKELKEFYKQYDDILKIAEEENPKIKSEYFLKKLALPLYNRCIKYKENHLYFLKNFKVDFDNNSSEQDLRVVKIKTKVSGGFRSINGIKNYADALSIIRTAKKRDINPYNAIKSIFNNEELFNN